MVVLPVVGHLIDLGERLVFIMFREEGIEVFEVESAICFDELFNELELGSSSVETVDHF